MKSNVLKINLQQGFLICATNNVPLAAYNHHTKEIHVKIPYDLNDITIPEEMNTYKFLRDTDSFGISMWSDAHQKNVEI